MKKKSISIILALALVMSLSVPVLATNGTQTDLTFTYAIPEPSFVVTIPGTLNLAVGDNNLPITAEVQTSGDLNGDTIVVTIQETNLMLGTVTQYAALMLYAPGYDASQPSSHRMFYQLYDADGIRVSYDAAVDIDGAVCYGAGIGTTLATFNDDDFSNVYPFISAKNINLFVDLADIQKKISAGNFQVDAEYTGFIRFGIRLQ